MKYYPDLLLLFTLLSVTTMIKAQISIRPYSEWEATQFVAVNGHQPEDYVTPDNNWEILYNLRTPRTQAELREMGIKCSDSQLLLLEVGGLVSKTKGKWKATIPILDKEQTNSLRSLSKEIAESMYVKTKADFISLAQTQTLYHWHKLSVKWDSRTMYSHLFFHTFWMEKCGQS